MKWFALALVVLNIAIWQLSDSALVGVQVGPAARGSLPRVASLKVSGESDSLPRFLVGERACVRMGWIPNLEAANALKAGPAMARASALSVEEVNRPMQSLHWVIIPPQPPAAALEQFRAMQKQGIDSYLVTEGENTNAISLGLFESRSAAISVLEEKKRNNFNVVLVNFDRNQISYALSFEAEPDLVTEMVQAAEADYKAEFDFIEVNRCESVATSGKNP